MIGDITAAHSIYIVCGYTDMRKSIDGLCAIVKDELRMDPNTRSLFLFCGRRCDRMGKIREILGTKQLYKMMLKIAIPVSLQGLITVGVNLMDTVMLGSYGEVQLSGSSLANDFINIFHILCMGMGGGAAVLTAQYWGAGDIPSLKKSITIMLRFCFALSSFSAVRM